MQHVTTRMSIVNYPLRIVLPLVLICCAAPALWAASPQQQYALAAGHYQNSRWQLAVTEFDALLDEHADDRLAAEARFYAGEACIQLGQYESAARRLDAFLQQHAAHSLAAQALFRRGECDYFRQRYAQARGQFRSFLDQYPRHELHEFTLPYLGELCLTAGDWEQSQSHYQQALRRFPSGRMADQCRFGLAQALEQQGDAAAAERFYRLLTENTKLELAGDANLRLAALLVEQQRGTEALDRLQQVIDNEAQAAWHGEAQYLLLKTRHARGEWSAVVDLYEQAFAGNEEAAHLTSALVLTAGAQQQQGNTAEARELYRQVIGQHTDPQLRNESLIELFSLELAANNPSAAHTALSKLTSLAAADPRVTQLQRIWIVHEIGAQRYDEARDFLNQLSAQHAKNLKAELGYFTALIALGRHEYREALAALDELKLSQLPAETIAPVRFARASALMNLKRYPAAIEALEAYLAEHASAADAPRCRELLVLALAHQSRWEQAARAHGDLSTKQNPTRYFPLTRQLADMALAAEEQELAQQLYEELAAPETQAPSEIVGQALAALARLQRGEADEAPSPALSRLLKEFPESQLACTTLLESARSAASRGEQARALAAYHRVIDRFGATASAAEAMLGAALIYDQLSQPCEAEASWRLLLANDRGETYRDAALYNLAWSLIEQDRREEANEYLGQIANEHRESKYWHDATLRLAQWEYGRGEHRQARHWLELVLARELDPPFAAHAHYLHGRIAAESHDWPTVDQAMRRVLEAGEGHRLHRPAKYYLAEALYQQHKYEQAQPHLSALTASTPQGEAWEAMIPLRQAQCLAYGKQWQEAEKLVATLSERFPDFDQQYEADYLLGRCLAAQAKFADAREAYQRALNAPLAEGTETASLASWMIGETWFHAQRYDEALQAYYRTAGFSPHATWQAAALLQAGKCHEVQGEWDKAAQRYSDLLAISPRTRFHAAAHQRLAVARRRVVAQAENKQQTR